MQQVSKSTMFGRNGPAAATLPIKSVESVLFQQTMWT